MRGARSSTDTARTCCSPRAAASRWSSSERLFTLPILSRSSPFEVPLVHDVVIFGSGPSGHTAALYTSRANLKPVVYEGLQPGGQLTITTDVDNFPGFPEGIMGPELMERMKAQTTRFGAEYHPWTVVSVELSQWPFQFTLDNGEVHHAKAMVISTGAAAQYLGLENETRLQGYGVSACATCDGFFYGGKTVGVVGGGDSACEEATFLTKFAEVHLFVRRDELRASKIMRQRVFDNDKVTVHWNTSVIDVLGDKEVTGVRLIDNKTNAESDFALDGLFLAIGHKPNSGPFVEWLDSDETGYLLTAPDSAATKIPGVFAAGDVQDHTYRQAITAAGSGCMAALEVERWLEHKGYESLSRREGF
ncbi:MAG: thioredoxin-disulfide reductase [Proteobacteria bacterium]|nr:thioredoxin-disulfide reductase [Pseudomonadota bacterium]MCP4917011.1 thioredoxin-disulfide reductase [Pseudomonadota bacterium]